MRTSISSQPLNGIYKQSNKTLKINSTLLKNSLKRTKCCVKPDELVTLIKKHYWDKTKTVKYQTTDGSEVSHRTYSFEAKLKDCDIPIKFVVIFGKWNVECGIRMMITPITSLLPTSSLPLQKPLSPITCFDGALSTVSRN